VQIQSEKPFAFPKNQQAKCLLTNAPSNVSESQLKELDIEITIDE